MKTIATLCAALVLGGCATAQPAPPAAILGLAFTAPPEPYASAARAALPGIPFAIVAPRDLRLICGDSYACAIMSERGCMIVVAEAVWQNDDVVYHEAAHCVGWPADHPGGIPTVTIIVPHA